MKDYIDLSVDYAHPIERVWAAISEAEKVSQWLMPTDIEPVVGHRFNFKTKPSPGFDGNVKCEIKEVRPPYKLVYTWSGGPLKDTLVSWELSPTPNGTHLHFRHSNFKGFVSKVLIRRILANGWKKLLRAEIANYLSQ